jgi:hypothetical protein
MALSTVRSKDFHSTSRGKRSEREKKVEEKVIDNKKKRNPL